MRSARCALVARRLPPSLSFLFRALFHSFNLTHSPRPPIRTCLAQRRHRARAGARHVPYRDSLLTQLMSDSIGGNAKTIMFVNVAPTEDDAEESRHSLQFARRCKKVSNRVGKMRVGCVAFYSLSAARAPGASASLSLSLYFSRFTFSVALLPSPLTFTARGVPRVARVVLQRRAQQGAVPPRHSLDRPPRSTPSSASRFRRWPRRASSEWGSRRLRT